MEHLLAITILNDFVFCPYSIYLHQIYDFGKEDSYHSNYQAKGKRLHQFIDENQDKTDWKNAYVYSEKYGIYGKIDDYLEKEKELIEYKSKASIVYQGYYYQIWSQYLCLLEMNIQVERLAFYDFREKVKIPISIPTDNQIKELINHINKVKTHDFTSIQKVNPNKCMHCIYNNLCERKL